MGFVDDAPREHLETVAEWRAWLEQNHTTSTGVFLVSWKSTTGRPAVPYEAGVEHALCFGWIDSRAQTIDEERAMLWYAPRKRGSAWAATNKARVEKLIAAGLMTPAGLELIESAKADGSWMILDPVDRGVVPDDLAEALDARPGARAAWDGFPRSVRRSHLEWLVFAKTAATRERRIAEIAEKAERGERARQ